MNQSDDPALHSRPEAVRVALILVAVTVGLSLLYALQYFAGSPFRLAVVSQFHDLDVSSAKSLVAAAAEDGSVRVWDTQQDWEMRVLPAHSGAATGVAFSPDGSILFSSGHDGKVRKWDVAAGEARQDFDAGSSPLNDMDLSADGSTLATVGQDGIARVFDTASGQMLQAIGPNENVGLAVALSPDGSQLAASDGVNIQLWDAHTGNPVRTLAGYCEDETISAQKECDKAEEDWLGHEKDVTVLAFSPDGEILASGSDDTTIIFWETASGEAKWDSGGHWAAVTAMGFNSKGNGMLSGGADSKVRSWRLPGGKGTAYYEGHLSAVNGVAFGATADTMLTAGNDGTLREWETANQKIVRIEWSEYGLQPEWGETLVYWMLFSGLVGLFVLWGLWRLRPWGHLLALTLYILGPVVILGLPLLETLTYPLSIALKLQIAWPLMALALWYLALVSVLMRESVADFYEAPPGLPLSDRLMIGQHTRRLRLAILTTAVWFLVLVVLYSTLRRFNLDISFMRHWLPFVMKGSGLTVFVSLVSIVLAVILALLGALGRLSKSSIANGISGFYISLIRGTPLLVQVYIWYLGLPRLGIVLQPVTAGILALGVNYGAYMTEIFRAGIQAIGKGQYEAAEALGMSRVQVYRRIVLPQAFRIVIPPIGNQFIAMMKDSSLVSLMSVWELSYRAQKVGRQYFRSLETFIIAAAFYWILTVIFQLLQGKLEEYMARGERR
ncbi:MAG TPA: ABC transporter permease subunit [Chloroflexi bacterium]|nr:ABC transporter permease subunit [Chloroflexota bacterium]